ncbi:MAG: Zn-ribbon protein [Acidimicrobiales bacterium]|nr:Zn-ribbon protein [Acidimicrobiales bacterium]
MTADAPLEALLVVQGHDTRLDQIHHNLAALPARAERDEAVRSLAAVEAEIVTVTAVRDDLARDQKRLDDEVSTLEGKRKGFDTKLYSGTITNPRELQDLQEEIEALGRRIGVLEDRELSIMEQVEPVEARLAALTASQEQGSTARSDAELRLTAAEAELAVALEQETGARRVAAASVPDDLLASYEKLRSGLGGVGVARLVGNQCGGCHLTLSAMEAARMRKLGAGEVGHCDECGRILVP